MIICETIAEIRQAVAAHKAANSHSRIGLVPTMGFLHSGHASLMRRAADECTLPVLSIFVNPLQFGPNEDFDRYPRDISRDLKIAEENGIAIVFAPTVKEMYPQPIKARVLVSDLTDRLCGASRPGHFDGVGTVVSKLFHIVQPDAAYFGLKDAQQVAVIEQMVADLNFPVAIIPCETVREADGLALSSRNVYLKEEERQQAVVLSQTLIAAEVWIAAEPNLTFEQLIGRVRSNVAQAPLGQLDYAEVLAYPSLQPFEPGERPSEAAGKAIVALAVKFGTTRLIDNRLINLPGGV